MNEFVWVDRDVIEDVGCLRAFDNEGMCHFQDGRPASKSVYAQVSGWTPELLEQVLNVNGSLRKTRRVEWEYLKSKYQPLSCATDASDNVE